MKYSFYKPVSLLTILAVIAFFSGTSIAAEHPGTAASEHPGTQAAAEHKEHPGKTHGEEHPGEKEMLSADKIIKGIKDHISSVAVANNGIFPIRDSETGEDLRLKLVKVHEDKVSYIKKDDAYFACTDFLTDDGKATYDVDFWMKEGADGKLNVYMTKIHKKDGKSRFTYKDDEIVEVK